MARGADSHRRPTRRSRQPVGNLTGPLPAVARRVDVAVVRPSCSAHVPAERLVQRAGGLQMLGDQRRILLNRCRVVLLECVKAFNELLDTGGMLWHGPAITILVEPLLARGGDADLLEAQDAIGRLEAVPTETGLVFHELPLLQVRALPAEAHGDAVLYRNFVERYRATARSIGFEGHVAWANAML
jgi:hypothetical protein